MKKLFHIDASRDWGENDSRFALSGKFPLKTEFSPQAPPL